MNQGDNHSLKVCCDIRPESYIKNKRLQEEANRKKHGNNAFMNWIRKPANHQSIMKQVHDINKKLDDGEKPRENVLQFLNRDRFKCCNWTISQSLRRWIQEFNDDAEIILAVKSVATGTDLERGTFWIQEASFRLRNNKNFVLQMTACNDSNFQYASPELRDDKDFLLELIQECSENFTVLKHASPRLQNDPQAVLAAFSKNPESFLYASDDLRGNKRFMIQAVQVDGMLLKYATKNLRDDEDVVSHAVQNNGSALEFASPRLQDNKAVVIAAVRNCGCVLGRASPRLRADFETALTAVQNDSLAMYFVSVSLQRNIDIVANAELKNLQLPLLLKQLHNKHNQPRSLFPYFLEKANRQPLIIYYLLKNRHDLIPSQNSIEVASQVETVLMTQISGLTLENGPIISRSSSSESSPGHVGNGLPIKEGPTMSRSSEEESSPGSNVENHDDSASSQREERKRKWIEFGSK